MKGGREGGRKRKREVKREEEGGRGEYENTDEEGMRGRERRKGDRESYPSTELLPLAKSFVTFNTLAIQSPTMEKMVFLH